MIKLGIAGVCGKMGRRIFELACKDKDFEIALALEKKGTPLIGKELGKLKISSGWRRGGDTHAVTPDPDPGSLSFLAP